eukprot:601833-Rhodomonas_salina.1
MPRPRKTPCSPRGASLPCSTRSLPRNRVHLHPQGRNHETSACLLVWISYGISPPRLACGRWL